METAVANTNNAAKAPKIEMVSSEVGKFSFAYHAPNATNGESIIMEPVNKCMGVSMSECEYEWVRVSASVSVRVSENIP